MKHVDIIILFEDNDLRNSKLKALKLINDLMRKCETKDIPYKGLAKSKDIIDQVWRENIDFVYSEKGSLGKAVLAEIKRVEPILYKRLNFIKNV